MITQHHLVAGRAPIKANTFIGGIAKQGGTGVNAPIDTPELLAIRLGIDVSRITAFRVTGDDVQCKINSTYSLPSSVFQNNVNITHFRDLDSLVISVSGQAPFLGVSNITEIILNGLVTAPYLFLRGGSKLLNIQMNNMTSVGTSYFLEGVSSLTTASFPRLTNICLYFLTNALAMTYINLKQVKNINGTPAENLVITNLKLNCVIDINIAMATINNGAPAAFLIWLKNNRNATVNFYDDNGNFIETL